MTPPVTSPKRRPPYSKLVDELVAEWERELAQSPKPEPFTFPPHTELDEYGFPIDGGDAKTLPEGDPSNLQARPRAGDWGLTTD